MSNVVQKSGRTGRPPGFDQERVIEAARDLFWLKGLAGTSYEELTLATGLHRPSIHAAFGDKRGLFRAALARYLRDSASMVADALSRSTLAEAMDAFFAADLALFVVAGNGRGCYALGVAAEAGRSDPELAEIEGAAWRNLAGAISDRIERAPRREVPGGLDRALLTDLVLATHATVATRARAGESVDQLQARVTRFLRLFSDA